MKGVAKDLSSANRVKSLLDTFSRSLINKEEYWSKNRTLRNTSLQRNFFAFYACVPGKPGDCCSGLYMHLYMVVDGVPGA